MPDSRYPRWNPRDHPIDEAVSGEVLTVLDTIGCVFTFSNAERRYVTVIRHPLFWPAYAEQAGIQTRTEHRTRRGAISAHRKLLDRATRYLARTRPAERTAP